MGVTELPYVKSHTRLKTSRMLLLWVSYAGALLASIWLALIIILYVRSGWWSVKGIEDDSARRAGRLCTRVLVCTASVKRLAQNRSRPRDADPNNPSDAGHPELRSSACIRNCRIPYGLLATVPSLADNPGMWMDHCHILEHAAVGMVLHLMYDNVMPSYEAGKRSGNLPE